MVTGGVANTAAWAVISSWMRWATGPSSEALLRLKSMAALMMGMALLCFWGEAGTDPFQVKPGEFHFWSGLFQVRGVGIRYGLCGLLLGIVVFA